MAAATSVLEAKWWYSAPRVTPARSAISSRPVSANPFSAKSAGRPQQGRPGAGRPGCLGLPRLAGLLVGRGHRPTSSGHLHAGGTHVSLDRTEEVP